MRHVPAIPRELELTAIEPLVFRLSGSTTVFVVCRLAKGKGVRALKGTSPARIAAIVPCHNEEGAVRKVVTDLKDAVPGIEVYVYDNCSTDRTGEFAVSAGAIVRLEHAKGKGNVVRRAFADVEADIYLLIDGDDTYEVADAPAMIEELLSGPFDHVLGVRSEVAGSKSAYRPGHRVGNQWLNAVVGLLFRNNVKDMLSGYRVMSRRFVKSFPAVSREFEIETELTVHCLALRVPQTSLEIQFRDRSDGSESKLRTGRDGMKILRLIIALTRHERPVAFYGAIGSMMLLVAGILMIPILAAYAETGLVPRFPTLFLALTLVLIGVLLWSAGLVLDGIRKSRHEQARLNYLHFPAIGTTDSISSSTHFHASAAGDN